MGCMSTTSKQEASGPDTILSPPKSVSNPVSQEDLSPRQHLRGQVSKEAERTFKPFTAEPTLPNV